MAGETNSSTPVDETTTNRRKSGRQVRKPKQFGDEEHYGSVITNGSAKRKRTSGFPENIESDEDGASDSPDDEEEVGDDDDDEPDEEELKEQRKASKSRKKPSRVPASKKAKVTNGTGPALAIRPAKSATQKGSKVQKARARLSQMNEQGLYGEIDANWWQVRTDDGQLKCLDAIKPARTLQHIGSHNTRNTISTL